MSVDLFGRHISEERRGRGLTGPPGPGFSLTTSGDYSLEDKRLCQIANPTDAQDAVNLRSLHAYSNSQERKFVLADTFEKLYHSVKKIQDLIRGFEIRVGALDGLLASVRGFEDRLRAVERGDLKKSGEEEEE